MAHRIDAEHEQEGGSGAVVSLRPQVSQAAPRARPVVRPVSATPEQEAPTGGKRFWDKNHFGFWLAVCIAISLLFSIVYRALA